MKFMDRIPKLNALAPTYGATDDRSYYPGGVFYGDSLPNSPSSAMRLITVQNCVRVRVATISQLPCHIMEMDGKNRNKATDFYLYSKLHDQPNSWQTSSEFWGMVEAHVCLHGQLICYKLGLEGRPIQEILPIQPDSVVQIIQNQDYSLTYKLRLKSGQVAEFPQSKIVHFRGLTLDGINGVNPIEYARETIGVGQSSTRFLSNYFGKGMHPGAIIKSLENLDPVTHANKWQAYKIKYGGLDAAQDLMLLDGGSTIEFPPIKLVDAQYLELMKMNEAQICGLYRVPLMLIQSGDKTPTFASAEQFTISYVVYGVTPDVVNYEKVIWRDLLTIEERKKFYAKFSVDALLRGDFKTRMEGFQVGVNTCIINPNEARELMEMNPYEGGEIYETRTSTVKDTSTAQSDSNQGETKK